jgi:fucose permease
MVTNASRRAIAVCCAVIFLYGTIASLLGTLLPTLSAQFRLSPEQNGYIASVQAIGLMLATLLAGPLMDSKGIKLTLCGGLTLMFIGLLALLSASQWPALVMAIFVLGLGSGTVVAAANNLASQVDEQRRASMVNFANVFFGLGGLATPFIAANLLSGNPMRLAYLVAALALIVLFFALTTVMPARSDQHGFDLAEVMEIQHKRLLLLLCLVALLYVGCEVGFWNWLPKYLMSRGGNARTALNTLGFGFACGIIAGRLIAMQVLRRVSAPIVCIAASAAMIVATYATLHLANSTSVVIAVFCSGVAMGPVYPSAIGITGDSFRRMTGTCIGLVITFGWFGVVVSSWIIGSIAGSDPRRLGKALLVIPLSSVVMVVLSIGVQRMVGTTRVAAAKSITL